MVALGSLVLAGAGTAAAAGLLAGAVGSNSGLTGGDQDLVHGTVIEAHPDRRRALAQSTNDAPAQARAGADRPRAAANARTSPTGAASGDGVAPATAPTGAGGPSGAGGPTGDTGGAGPKGDTGGAGPKTDTGGAGPKGDTGGSGPKTDTGSAGPNTDTGSAGPKTDTPAPAPQGAPAPAAAAPVFVVKDASGTTAGTLVSADPNGAWISFTYKDRGYVADVSTGALNLPTVETSYTTDDCSGTPYAPLSRPAKSVLRSINPSETGIYVYGQPGSVDVRSIWQPGEGVPDRCITYVYTNTELAPLQELSASERPPTLKGPLKSVRAS